MPFNLGEIYGRPVVIANFAFGIISFILLFKYQLREPAGFYFWIVTFFFLL